MSDAVNEDLQETARFQAQFNGGPVAAVASDEGNAAAVLEMSIFEDAADFPQSRTYAFEVKFSGTAFRCNELSRDDLKHVMGETKSLEFSAKQIVRRANEIETRAVNMGRNAGTPEKKAEVRDLRDAASRERVDASEALAERVVALNGWVIEQGLRDWHNPKWAATVPCNTDTRAKLTRSVKAALSDVIIAKSYSGRAATDTATDFLER